MRSKLLRYKTGALFMGRTVEIASSLRGDELPNIFNSIGENRSMRGPSKYESYNYICITTVPSRDRAPG